MGDGVPATATVQEVIVRISKLAENTAASLHGLEPRLVSFALRCPTHRPGSNDIAELQRLDVIVQEIASIAGVLKTMSELTIDSSEISLERLSESTDLAHVRNLLMFGTSGHGSHRAGVEQADVSWF